MRQLTVCSLVGLMMCALPVLALASQDPVSPQKADAGIAKAQKDKEQKETPDAVAPGQKGAINLNSASLQQLETLPGVGPKMAERIVEYRQKSGGFKKIEELMNVKGIGEKGFLKIKPLVFVPAKADKAGQ